MLHTTYAGIDKPKDPKAAKAQTRQQTEEQKVTHTQIDVVMTLIIITPEKTVGLRSS